MVVMDIENTFNCLPDMYSMKEFIAICFPGLIAIDMALDCFRARMAMAFFSTMAVRASSFLLLMEE